MSDSRVSYGEMAEQLTRVASIVELGVCVAKNDIDALGRQVRKAIDANPDLEAGIVFAGASAAETLAGKLEGRGRTRAFDLRALLYRRSKELTVPIVTEQLAKEAGDGQH